MQVIYNACDIQLSYGIYIIGFLIVTFFYYNYKEAINLGSSKEKYYFYREYFMFNTINENDLNTKEEIILTRKIVFISSVVLVSLIVVADTWHYFYIKKICKKGNFKIAKGTIKEIKCENGTLKWVKLDDKLFKYDDVLTTTDNINCKKKIFNKGNYLQYSYMVKNGKKIVVMLKVGGA